jgi:predicted DNA-binding transcriptional regulator YafY
MQKPIRMLDLIATLRAARLTAADIADRLGASVRTVYRDIAALQAMGVPIDGAPRRDWTATGPRPAARHPQPWAPPAG